MILFPNASPAETLTGYTVVEGEFIERSDLPDPAYPDCRFTASSQGDAILSGPACKRHIVLVIDGFKKFKLLAPAKIRKGAKVVVTLKPYDQLSDQEKSIWQADDLNFFELDNYDAANINIIPKFTESPNHPTSGTEFLAEKHEKYVSVFERQLNPPVSSEFIQAQQNQILKDLKKATELLENYAQKRADFNKLFTELWKKEKAKDAPGYNRVCINNQTYVWRNINGTFWTLPENYKIFLSLPTNIPDSNLRSLQSLKIFLEKKRRSTYRIDRTKLSRHCDSKDTVGTS